ncbi:Ca2+-binding EF-hand superfamily protein [Thermocatellispora tengchongensis]|uniref:Ca2+-binding EF-hand superfamily protein n=1 Tax=Thermocatellispora tengchongensis TaxID=1073253 RepID=A0A840P8M8_9ACTN|nr:EF-hand domain-containing protein [Thermocatellispora tengchongensis]MBB5134273.1 Ca2+-binding EF-hand superfamily protein [Thermocatellispora tengchongensis]
MAEEVSEARLGRLREEFAAIDTDGDGYITEAEFRAHFPGLPAEALPALSLDGDADGDGRYSLEEFIRLMP